MSFETVLSDDREEQRFQESLRAKKARRGQISQANEAREMVKRASQKCSAPEKSAIQLEYEQEQARRAEIDAELLMQEQLQKQGSSASLDRLMQEQQQRVKEYYSKTKPADEIKDDIAKGLKIDEQPETQTLEAFSLGSFNPKTKQFGDITFHSLQIEEHKPLEVKGAQIKHASAGKILVAKCTKRYTDQQVKHINIMNGMDKFGGGTKKEKIIVPIRLTRKAYKDKTLSGSQVNDMLMKGYKEIDRNTPEIIAIVSAHDKDTRLIHSGKEIQSKAVINSAKLGVEEPREIIEFALPKACNVPSCSICFSKSEVGEILDYQSQQSVFL